MPPVTGYALHSQKFGDLMRRTKVDCNLTPRHLWFKRRKFGQEKGLVAGASKARVVKVGRRCILIISAWHVSATDQSSANCQKEEGSCQNTSEAGVGKEGSRNCRNRGFIIIATRRAITIARLATIYNYNRGSLAKPESHRGE